MTQWMIIGSWSFSEPWGVILIDETMSNKVISMLPDPKCIPKWLKQKTSGNRVSKGANFKIS
jgi:hypothetical protein